MVIKKVAAIHDLSGIGRCSLSVAISTLSVMKLQVCPMPTAILSNQTGFSSFSFFDFTPHMEEYAEGWKDIQYTFDCIYTGFLGSKEQVNQIINFMKYFKHEKTLVVIDPVMGDEGMLYDVYDESYIEKMRELITYADVITPNYTELLLLLGEPQRKLTLEEIHEGARKLSQYGPKKIVVTGIIEGEEVSNYGFDFEQNKHFKISAPYNQKSYSGTGDLLASIVSGLITKGHTLEKAVSRSTRFISKAIDYTEKLGVRPEEGIVFEYYLGELMEE